MTILNLMVLYAHFLACCLALGSIGSADWRLWQNRCRVWSADEIATMRGTEAVVSVSLIALWITGALLIALGYHAEPQKYLTNQKLWAKLTVVVVLTLNGWLLHRWAFPKLSGGTAFACLPWRERVGLGLAGAVSSASWLFAGFLGVARPWNHSLAYLQVISGYAIWLAFAMLGAGFIAWALGRSSAIYGRWRSLGLQGK